jgi:hypothetical protein
MGGGWCIFFDREDEDAQQALKFGCVVDGNQDTHASILKRGDWRREVCDCPVGDDGEDGLEGGKKQGGEKSETKANGKGLSVCFSLG